jgi:seryl-tRNA synthetase
MLEIKFVRQNLETVRQALDNRGAAADLAAFVQADEERKTVLGEIEQLRHRRNMVSNDIAALKKAGENADALVTEMRHVGDRIKHLEKDLTAHESTLSEVLLGIPNIPDPSVPVGRDETENTLVKTNGEKPSFDFTPQAHWDIGANLGILDFGRAARITGARFPLYLGAGARWSGP